MFPHKIISRFGDIYWTTRLSNLSPGEFFDEVFEREDLKQNTCEKGHRKSCHNGGYL